MYRKTRLSSYLPEITVHLDSRFSDPIVNYRPIKQKNNLVNDINTYINLKNLETIIQKKINRAETTISEKYKKAELSIANILH